MEDDYLETKQLLCSAGFQSSTIADSVKRLLKEFSKLKSCMITLKLSALIDGWHEAEPEDLVGHERLWLWLGCSESDYQKWVQQYLSDEELYNKCDLRAPGHVWFEENEE